MRKRRKFSNNNPDHQEQIILHANVQSINNKYLEIEDLLNKDNCDILCLSETWADDDRVQTMVIQNFQLATYFNRKFFMHGGTAIFVRNNLEFKVRNDINKISFEMNFEISAIELKSSKLVVIAAYRPDKDIDLFYELLNKLLQKLCREGRRTVIAGDFNLNVLKPDKNVRRFLKIVNSFNYKCMLNEPTRIQGTVLHVLTIL